ncbi:hypothetical protein SS50377_26169 [Spironucleus salmonicida]|uniref:Transmembrane protein n=1 Tax=Spironucleus salmonicida TaxID=348837 RepID=V6LK25_9EUKA|nr:hypothetical protein SS50377_26169 [Spironucleus salmonicida]|eukprot:EST44902.1 Hypothetical protein SS50377_15196 [Spironucleus salmonicida]
MLYYLNSIIAQNSITENIQSQLDIQVSLIKLVQNKWVNSQTNTTINKLSQCYNAQTTLNFIQCINTSIPVVSVSHNGPLQNIVIVQKRVHSKTKQGLITSIPNIIPSIFTIKLAIKQYTKYIFPTAYYPATIFLLVILGQLQAISPGRFQESIIKKGITRQTLRQTQIHYKVRYKKMQLQEIRQEVFMMGFQAEIDQQQLEED